MGLIDKSRVIRKKENLNILRRKKIEIREFKESEQKETNGKILEGEKLPTVVLSMKPVQTWRNLPI